MIQSGLFVYPMSGYPMTPPTQDVYQLYLMRHAHAGPPLSGERDFDRRLDWRGRDEAYQVTRQAEAFGITPSKVISSAASRCLETAKIFMESQREIMMEVSDNLYAGTMETYCALISQNLALPSLMIIGHNPTIEEIVELLIGRSAMAGTLPYGFPTAGILCIEMERPIVANAKPPAKMRFLITPSFSEAF